MVRVSIIVPAYNEEYYIDNLINSILKQTFLDFELIIIDDSSIDNTPNLIQHYQDKRIKYIRNKVNIGVTKSTNLGIKNAVGEYIFFTGADCTPLVNWIENGVIAIENNKGVVGVYGQVKYATSLVSISDRIVETEKEIYGANMAFRKKYLELVGGMDEDFKSQEDRDLAFRIKKYGEIIYSDDMIVIHQRKFHTKDTLFSDAKRSENMVRFIKVHRDFANSNLLWRILYPKKLLILMCPFIIIFAYSFRRWSDFKIGFWMYIAVCYMRVRIWKTALRERLFVL